MTTEIIGRKKELSDLQEYYDSNEAEFIVIYGRRRVGKTFLVHQFFQNRFDFCVTGLSPVESGNINLKERQLENFQTALNQYGIREYKKQSDWFEAFNSLQDLLTNADNQERQVVFIDELPWMDTASSGFITALEHFWNNWAAHRSNLMFIVCGSATSYIIDNVINNTGGLYNRITHPMLISPFTLSETESYLSSRGIPFDRIEILRCYMVMGGIPYYLRQLKRGKSLAQNVDDLFFSPGAPLSGEYERLFSSLFKKPEIYRRIIEILAGKKTGYSRTEICALLGKKCGGDISRYLKDLKNCFFISSYYSMDKKRDIKYRLCDYYTLFYLKFIKGKEGLDPKFWSHTVNTPVTQVWSGLTFELICLTHVEQIKRGLGISGVLCNAFSWWNRDAHEDGAQIDLVLERGDRAINLCEIKFCANEPFLITKDYADKLRQKVAIFRESVKTRATILTTLVSTFGIVPSKNSSVIQCSVTMDDLFD